MAAEPSRAGPAWLRAPQLMKLKLRVRSEEHTSELQSRGHLVCRLLLARRPPSSPLFPYTTLFRSQAAGGCPQGEAVRAGTERCRVHDDRAELTTQLPHQLDHGRGAEQSGPRVAAGPAADEAQVAGEIGRAHV